MRIGHGYDVHRLIAGRKLILGGVEIPYILGLDGHSDADVLLHAMMDALLGAAALGDIGHLFPDTDPAYKGISSLKLLAVAIGAVLYYLVYQVVIWLGLNPDDMKLVTALIVAAFLAIPYWKGQLSSRTRSRANQAKEEKNNA